MRLTPLLPTNSLNLIETSTNDVSLKIKRGTMLLHHRQKSGQTKAILMTVGNHSDPNMLPVDLALPAYIGKLTPINSGGMGAVFEAVDLGTGSKLAVKALLPRHLQNDNERKRFIREAEVISSLSNSHIVEIKDYGVSSSNTPYMVMEYITGNTLYFKIQSQGPLSVESAVEIFSQIADGLEHAHSKGILHRDLKPTNVMLAYVDGKTVVKIVDFGIAKFYKDNGVGGEDEPLTLAGECMGTPMYMSPEQCMAQPLDARSDVYSFGCVLYHCLTGKVPLLGASPMETLRMHVTAPVDLSLVPPAMRQLLSKCLEKDPADRYQSMKAVSQDLARLRDTGKTRFRLETSQKKLIIKVIKQIIFVILGFAVGYGVLLVLQLKSG